jgi:hypothetical protein
MTVDRCAEICLAEDKCLHFSVIENKTCSRFDNTGDGCVRKRSKGFVTYEKLPRVYNSPSLESFDMIDHQEQCRFGYYAGHADDYFLTMTAGLCAEICESEPQCRFFAFKPFETCSRFDGGAMGCERRSGKGFELYKKKAPKEYNAAALVDFNFIDHTQECQFGLYASVIEEADLLTMTAGRCAEICAVEDRCLYFSYKPFESCSRFDDGANNCFRRAGTGHTLYEKKAPKEFSSAAMSLFHMIDHTEHCQFGYYAGHADNDVSVMTAGLCAEICASEERCLFFAYKPFETCSRFDAGANGCVRRTGKGYTLYAKNMNN